MTELALIFAFGVLGLVFAAYLARWVLLCPPVDDGGPTGPAPPGMRAVIPPPASPGDREMTRVAGLVRVAAETFFRKQSSTILAVSAVLGGAIFLAYGLRRAGEGDPVPALELGVWLTLSFVLGARTQEIRGTDRVRSSAFRCRSTSKPLTLGRYKSSSTSWGRSVARPANLPSQKR